MLLSSVEKCYLQVGDVRERSFSGAEYYDPRQMNDMFNQPRQGISYSADEALLDSLTGVPAVGLILVTALLLGGFSFFTPWLIVTPLTLLFAGLIRARSDGNPLLKALVISLPSLILVMLLGRPIASMLGISALLLLPPCAIGIWIRRRRYQVSP